MPEMRVDLRRDGAARFKHGDCEVSQGKRERRQRRDAASADLAVALPAGQAAVQEADGQRDPADGFRFRQVAQVRHHELRQFGLSRAGGLLWPGARGRLGAATEPQQIVR